MFDKGRTSTVLVVDDTPENIDLLDGVLNQDYKVKAALNGEKALKIAGSENPPDIILLDIMMPGMDGYEVCRHLKADPKTRDIPIIFITARSYESDETKGFEIGAVDYITKPFSPPIVQARIKTHLALKHNLEKLQRANKIIESQKKRMEKELNIGRQIQSSFFPESLPHIDGWEIVAHFQAAREVSGDFYDAFILPTGGDLVLVIADICDKGVGAGLFMVVFRSLIRAFSEGRQFNYNSEEFLLSIVSSVNKYITTIHEKSNMFATVFFGVLEPKKNTLFYINAGHELPLIVDAEGNLKKLLESTGPAIGLMPDLDFAVDKVEMEIGDILIAYTDGAVDARNEKCEPLSEETFISYIKKPYPSAYSLLKYIENQISEHMSGTRQFDDIALLALRRKKSASDEKHEITKLAILENLPIFRGFIEQASIHMDLDENVTFAFKLAVEEVCTNIITYGYAGTDPGLIKLTFESDSEKAKLTVYDEGISFDPENAAEADVESGWEEREIGGLGLFMVREVIDEVNYENRNGMGNFLSLTKHLNTK